jgi:hypothetical protein
MRIVTNVKLARRNKQWSQYLFFASLGLLLLGLFVINRPTTTSVAEEATLLDVILSTVPVILAYAIIIVSIRMTNLWVRQPRPEVAISEGLKGVNPKTVLYSYYHFPARHVLIAPQGVFAIITRFQDGVQVNVGDRWQTQRGVVGRLLGFFRFDAIGNPSIEAIDAAQYVKKLLQPIAGDIDVQPLVLFVDGRVQLQVENPVVPVVHANPKDKLSLKEYLLSVGKEKRQTLTPQQIEQFEAQTVSTK